MEHGDISTSKLVSEFGFICAINGLIAWNDWKSQINLSLRLFRVGKNPILHLLWLVYNTQLNPCFLCIYAEGSSKCLLLYFHLIIGQRFGNWIVPKESQHVLINNDNETWMNVSTIAHSDSTQIFSQLCRLISRISDLNVTTNSILDRNKNTLTKSSTIREGKRRTSKTTNGSTDYESLLFIFVHFLCISCFFCFKVTGRNFFPNAEIDPI